MVGLFSAYKNNMDKKEDKVLRGRDEDDEQNSLFHVVDDDDDYDEDEDDGDDDDDDDDGDDGDGVEFKPIEHPVEPPEDDEPAKCPTVPDLSFIYDDGDRKEPFTENPQNRAESFVTNEVDPRKHHKFAQDSANPFQLKGPHYNIFEVFQQCKEFGFS